MKKILDKMVKENEEQRERIKKEAELMRKKCYKMPKYKKP